MFLFAVPMYLVRKGRVTSCVWTVYAANRVDAALAAETEASRTYDLAIASAEYGSRVH